MQAEGGAGIDAQHAARGAARLRHLGLGLLDVGDDAAGARQEGFALGGERQAASAAFQQPHAQPVLQPRNQLRDGRGGYT